MQVVSPSSPAPRFVGKDRFAEVYGKLSDDFGSKLKMEEEENRHDNNNNLEESWWNQEEEEEEEEFSFTNLNAEKSPISAEEAFEDGQIRPVYPLFNRDLLFEKPLRSPLKKVFIESEEAAAVEEEESEEPAGPFCSWSGRTVEEEAASPETCRKSNSTGFSKLRRFRDLVLRSNSDGRDAFVFFNADKNNNQSSSSSRLSGVKKEEKGKEEKTRTVEKKMKRTKLSAHERLYMRNRALKEEGKRRSYLPYKHVGFFTNVNGLTRNVHPY